MIQLLYQNDIITIYEYKDAEKLIARLALENAGDITTVARGGRGRNKIEYYNYPCSFDIETTTIKPGELNYKYDPDAPPIAFPYLFQWNIYGCVIMARTYSEAVRVFDWIAEYFRLAKNRRLVIFDHNLGYEYQFFKGLWDIDSQECFALDEHHPVTLVTNDGFMFRDSYKMSNMSLFTLTKDWSKKWIKDPEIMDYSVLRTPYDALTDEVYIYSALDVLSLSDAIIGFLEARGENIWTRCPTSTSFIRKDLKKDVGIGVKVRTKEQKEYFKMREAVKIDADIYSLLKLAGRGGNTHNNRRYTGLLLHNVCHFDICSSYPAQMVCYPEFPIGPWYPMDIGSGPEDIEFLEASGFCTLFSIVLTDCELKPGVTVPYISTSKMVIVEGEGMRASDNGRYMGGLKNIALHIFGVEWSIIKQQYSFSDAIIIKGYFAKKGYLPDIIRRFVLGLYAKKTELKGVDGKEVEYMLAKQYVNGVFGMAYTDPIRNSFEVLDDCIAEKPPADTVAALLDKYQRSKSYFMPYAWGAMVACLGRVMLQKMINAVGDDFIYCDTDSIFALHPEESRRKIRALADDLNAQHAKCGLNLTYYDIKGRPHTLGNIDEEPICESFKSFGAKKYITVENGKLTCTIAGVPKKAGARIIGSPENFQLGLNFKGAETGKNCLWYNDPPNFELKDNAGRIIETGYNVAMLPCDYLLSLSADYRECLSIEGNFHWLFNEADKNGINEEDF